MVLRIGVIGVGVMGAAHVRYLAEQVPDVTVSALCDVDAARCEAVAAEVAAGIAATPGELFTGDLADAVIVASTDDTHVELALAALGAGIPALVEKPLAENAADAQRVVAAEAALGRRLLSVGFMRRFDRGHRKLSTAIGETIGQARLFRSIHRNPTAPPHWSAERAAVASAIHDIDSARWLLGDFTRVRAAATPNDGAPDVIHIQGEHSGGALSAIELATQVGYGYEVIAELVGEHGVVSTVTPTEVATRSSGAHATEVPQIWLDRFEAAYVDELRSWTTAVQRNESFSGASAWDGYVAQVVAEAVISSLDTGGVVDLPQIQPPSPNLY